MKLNLCMGCMENWQGSPCPICGYGPSKGKPLEYALPPQTILAGKYLVGRMLGQGGFGITYIGWDIALKRKVAIKEFYPNGLVGRSQNNHTQILWYTGRQAEQARKEGMDAFLREARKMTKVSDVSRVVQVKDLFYENGTAYIVMDFVEGLTLKKQIGRCGPMSWNQLKPILLNVAKTMDQVHKAGLIHRDLSPDNIMLTPDGDVRILDLGAAKDLNKNSGVSSMQVAKGGFSPPEQYFQQGTSGPCTDIYALAATAYYAITGNKPISAIDRMNKDDLNWNALEMKNVPDNVIRALRKAMSLNSQDRQQSMEEFAAQLTMNGSGSKRTISKPIRIAAAAAAVLCLVVSIAVGLGTKKDNTVKAEPVTMSTWAATEGTVPSDAGGANDIYRLSQASDLELLRKYPERSFVLTQDIVLPSSGIQAIEEFNGTLDGKGYWIKTVHRKVDGQAVSGLFQNLGSNAVVKNLNVAISMEMPKCLPASVSGLAGNNLGNIQNCTIQSDIVFSGDYDEAYTAIQDLGRYAPVSFRNGGDIENCTLITKGRNFGYIYGVVGENTGNLTNCQVEITTDGCKYICGLACRNWENSNRVDECSVAVTAKGILTFVCTSDQNYVPIRNCWFTANLTPPVGQDVDWKTIGFAGEGSSFDNSNTVQVKAQEKEVERPTNTDNATGNGSIQDPYRLRKPEDLERLRSEPKAHFILVQNIDLGGAAFTPIDEFSGTLDGNGFAISGLNPKFSKGESYWNGALFLRLTSEAVIKNLGIQCSLVPGKDLSNGAGITVRNAGLIQGCTVEAEANGCHAIGGVTQNNTYTGRILDCNVTVVTRDCKFVGGIGEYQVGTISDCQAKVDLTDVTSMGGIAYVNSGTVENCTASGTVQTKYTNGILAGVVGENLEKGTVTNCTATIKYAGQTLPFMG